MRLSLARDRYERFLSLCAITNRWAILYTMQLTNNDIVNQWVDDAIDFNDALKTGTPTDRLVIFATITTGFCPRCGHHKPQCKCHETIQK